MPRSLQRIPDYFTEEEAGRPGRRRAQLPGTRMAFRIMLRTGLRVSEALALRRVDLRLDQHPPIIVVRGRLAGQQGPQGPGGPRCRLTWSRVSGTWRRPTARTITSQC